MTAFQDADRIHLGTAGANVAGNIEALVPFFRAHGAEATALGNEIHELLSDLRRDSIALINDQRADPDRLVAVTRQIKGLLPRLSGRNVELDAVLHGVNGFTTQLIAVHGEYQRTLIGKQPDVEARTI